MSRTRIGRWLHDIRRRSWFFYEYVERESLRASLEEATSHVAGVLLDVGCGDKRYEEIFSDRVSAYYGLDYPATRHLSGGVPVCDIYGDGMHLPIAGDSVDTVLSAQVLEHVPEPWVAMDELARVLRPSGHLIVTVPGEWRVHGEPYDYYRFTRSGLRYLAERSGLEVVRIRQRGGFWLSRGQALSSTLYTVYCSPHSVRGAKVRYALASLIVLPICALSQWIGTILDRLQFIDHSTMGYILIARNPSGSLRTGPAKGSEQALQDRSGEIPGWRGRRNDQDSFSGGRR